jgi:hypothetical protein
MAEDKHGCARALATISTNSQHRFTGRLVLDGALPTVRQGGVVLLPGLGSPRREAIDFGLHRAGRLADELRVMIASVSVTFLPPFARALEVRVHISRH